MSQIHITNEANIVGSCHLSELCQIGIIFSYFRVSRVICIRHAKLGTYYFLVKVIYDLTFPFTTFSSNYINAITLYEHFCSMKHPSTFNSKEALSSTKWSGTNLATEVCSSILWMPPSGRRKVIQSLSHSCYPEHFSREPRQVNPSKVVNVGKGSVSQLLPAFCANKCH